MELGSTLEQQAALERVVSAIYGDLEDAGSLVLRREAHARYLLGGLRHLSAGHCGARASPPASLCARADAPAAALDASRPWLVFWITHSLALLEVPLPDGAFATRPLPSRLPLSRKRNRLRGGCGGVSGALSRADGRLRRRPGAAGAPGDDVRGVRGAVHAGWRRCRRDAGPPVAAALSAAPQAARRAGARGSAAAPPPKKTQAHSRHRRAAASA